MSIFPCPQGFGSHCLFGQPGVRQRVGCDYIPSRQGRSTLIAGPWKVACLVRSIVLFASERLFLQQVGQQRVLKVSATHNVVEEINRQTSNYQVNATELIFLIPSHHL